MTTISLRTGWFRVRHWHGSHFWEAMANIPLEIWFVIHAAARAAHVSGRPYRIPGLGTVRVSS